MATIKYLIQSTNNPASIYVRMSLGRGNSLKRKSGYVINPKFWSSTTGYPKATLDGNKSIKAKLISLEGAIIERYNIDNAHGKVIDGNWLLNVINELHNRSEVNKKQYLLEYTKYYLENLPNSVNNKGERGASKATITKYKTIFKKLSEFESFMAKKYLILQVDLEFRKNFINYLSDVDRINDNTIGRYISFIKTILYDARKNGYQLNHQILDFKGFSIKPPIVTLNFSEISKIKSLEFNDKALTAARDWLVIGCYLGQRVSDLLRLNKKMIHKIGRYNYIILTQVKTDKLIQIPIHQEVQSILNKRKGNFPPTFGKTSQSNSTIFNKLIKQVCRHAEINEKVKGNLNNPTTRRKETGFHEKWKLVSSHICRRSFATNFYSTQDYPTPLLMNITGHSTEAMFLNYVGKKPMDYSLQLAKLWNK